MGEAKIKIPIFRTQSAATAIAMALFAFCLNPEAACAQTDNGYQPDAWSVGSWHPFASIDYFGAGSAKNQVQNALNSDCQQAIANGLNPCAYAANVNGAEGGRFGAFRNMGGFDLGASLGYLYGGPGGAGSGNFNVPGGTLSEQVTVNTARIIGEIRKTFALSDPWSARVGGGAGWALAMENDFCLNSGALSGYCAGDNGSANTGWITWEVSAAIAYKSASLGLRYAGFGRGGQAPWNTIGAFWEYDF